MVNLDGLKKAPTVTEFRKKLVDDNLAQYIQVEAKQLRMNEKGYLELHGMNTDPLTLDTEALTDLAKLAKIPPAYFEEKCSDTMRAYNFNQRFKMELPLNENLEVKIAGSEALRVQDADLLRTSRNRILDSVLNGIPTHIYSGDLRVVNSQVNGILDISLVSPTTTSEPRKDDIVCFGVNVIEMKDGAVQVGTAIYRLICSNEAITKVCSGKQKIRRPKNDPDKENAFLKTIEKQTIDAWMQWHYVAKGLEQLTKEPVDNNFVDGMILRLQQRPFFVSKKIAIAIKDRVKFEARRSTLTLYEVWNALTFLASHPEVKGKIVPWQYSHRIRLGAGTMARSFGHICNECHQLVLSDV